MYHFMPTTPTENFIQKIDEINRICKENKINCVLISQPNGYRHDITQAYKNSIFMTPPLGGYTMDMDSMINISNLYNNYMMEYAKNHGLLYCDIAREFTGSFKYFFDDAHFNINGSREAATHIYNCINSHIKTENK